MKTEKYDAPGLAADVARIKRIEELERELLEWKKCAEMFRESLNPTSGPSGESIIDQQRDAEELLMRLSKGEQATDAWKRQYKDITGQPCSLDWLVKHEPEWAANQIRHRDKLSVELAEANEYARKLSIKVTDQGVEIQRLQATLQRKQNAGDLVFEELDDRTPEANCKCFMFRPCYDCDKYERSRAAIKAWKEANK